jgi:hypothetical protein
MDAGQMGVLIPIIGVCIPIVAIITSHQRKVLEMKLRLKGEVPNELKAELAELKKQVADLRDTTTKFDMSFDAAIGRLEDRVDKVEARQYGETPAANVPVASAAPTTPAPYGAPASEQNVLTVGQGR